MTSSRFLIYKSTQAEGQIIISKYLLVLKFKQNSSEITQIDIHKISIDDSIWRQQ
jgi:hypothetical protein